MKRLKLFYILALITLTQATLNAQWVHIYTYDEAELFALDVVTPDTVYIVGLFKAIRSFNGGESWNEINYNCSNYSLRDVNFPSEQIGYIVGSKGLIIKTSDYGENWQSIGPDTITEYVEVEFITTDTGWIIGNYSEQGEVILRTYDGGNTWDFYYSDLDGELADIQMLNSSLGYACLWDGILKTTNGGISWIPLGFSGGGPVLCCSFINNDTGFIGASGVYKTENGGIDWEFIADEHFIGYLVRSQLQFINADTGYYTGYDPVFGNGVLCVTTNGGYNWELLATGYYHDIEMFNDSIGYCIKLTGEIYKTTDGGLVNIRELHELSKKQLVDIYPNPFIDKLHIDFKEFSASYVAKHIEIQIADINGKIVFQQQLQYSCYTAHLNSLKPGIYNLAILSNDTVIKTGKFLKAGK